MSRRLHISVRLALLAALCCLGAFAQDKYFVKVTGDVNGIARRHGLAVVRSLTGSASGYHVLSSSGVDPRIMLHNLSMESAVNSAEAEKAVHLPGIHPGSSIHPACASSGVRFSSTMIRYYNSYAPSAYVNQPATDVINMDKAHTLATGQGVVATIDTGADFTHPVLKGSLVSGWDFVHNTPGSQEQADLNQESAAVLQDDDTSQYLDQETTPILEGGTAIILQDDDASQYLDQETTPILEGTQYRAYGHGTMVAGLIHLVAPNARILPVRAFGADGNATISQIVQAIAYAVDHGANVINMSFAVKQNSDALDAAIDAATKQGVICVASAGNDGQANPLILPAGYADVIGVAATDNSMIRASFSNYGSPLVTLAAPGAGVITTYPKGLYAQVWGTSFSAPLVSGAASLLLDRNGRTNETMAVADLSNATPIRQELGAGELDLYRACLAARK
jgi:subtilisin family serine protease